MPAISTGLAIGLTAAAVGGGVASAAIGAHAAGKAADAQTKAAQSAAELQRQSEKETLQFQKDVYAQQQKDQAPWLQAGQGAITSLSDLVKNGGFPNWTGQFQAPAAATEVNDPGYQFRLQEGQKTIERMAAAKGGLLSGGTAKALTQYGEDYASNEYDKVYGRAFGEYQTKYNEFQQGQANQYNRLAGISGTGQVSAGQLSSAGTNAANNVGNILLGSADAQGRYLQDAANARASGYYQSANAWGGTLNNIPNYILLSQLLKGNSGSSGPSFPAFGGR